LSLLKLFNFSKPLAALCLGGAAVPVQNEVASSSFYLPKGCGPPRARITLGKYFTRSRGT
jgi:hypothetical protein